MGPGAPSKIIFLRRAWVPSALSLQQSTIAGGQGCPGLMGGGGGGELKKLLLWGFRVH